MAYPLGQLEWSSAQWEASRHYDMWDDKFFGMQNLKSSLDNTVMIAD